MTTPSEGSSPVNDSITEAERVVGLQLAADLMHTITGIGSKPMPGPNTLKIARNAIDALRSLPVEERMEIMGMRPFTNNHLTHLYESAGSKAPALWIEAS